MFVKIDIKGSKLAIICGSGALPRLLAEECRDIGQEYTVVEFEHITLDWAKSHPIIPAVFEQPGQLFARLQSDNYSMIVMAGAMVRAQIDITRLDDKGQELAATLAKTLRAGDDRTLSSIVKFFETNGFTVIGAHEVRQDLLPNAGVLTNVSPSEDDKYDVQRAAEIVESLGHADVGQAAVVAQGICLGLESIQGTDRLLAFVKDTREGYVPDTNGGKGILLKAPKPGQDLRVDLPTIGPDTVRNVFDAGLSGIVVEAGGVMVLAQRETVSLANDLGIFLWIRPKG